MDRRSGPNTDTALMLALAYALLTEKPARPRVPRALHCVGFEKFAPYLTGAATARPRRAWAAAITGVPAARIAALAREMAATRTMVNIAWSLQRAASRRAAVLDAGHAGLHAGPDRPAGRRLRRSATAPTNIMGSAAVALSPARRCRRAPTRCATSSRSRASPTCC